MKGRSPKAPRSSRVARISEGLFTSNRSPWRNACDIRPPVELPSASRCAKDTRPSSYTTKAGIRRDGGDAVKSSLLCWLPNPSVRDEWGWRMRERVGPSELSSIASAAPPAHLIRGSGGSVLQLSMRRLHDLVAFCLPYEFEDVVAQVAGADRVEPENYRALELARRAYKLVRLTTRSRRLARALTPQSGASRLTRDYELFFPVFNNPFELFSLL